MSFNYSRGNQMVINDPRLYWKTTETNRIPIAPPDARHRFTAMPGDSVENIVNIATQFAAIDGKLDALHLLAHGAPGYLQLGKDGLDRTNAKVFRPLRDKVRVIVIYGCNTGHDVGPGLVHADKKTLSGAIAAEANAKVIVCNDVQYFGGVTRTITGRGGVLFGDDGFEGPVYICSPNGDTQMIYADSRTGKAQINLEAYIFGYINN